MSDCVIRARIDAADKAKANMVFESMGLTMSDAIRIFIKQAVIQKKMPFSIKAPNAKTLRAIQDVKEGKNLRKTTMEGLRNEWHKACEK